jgi:hypothetical protein
LSLGEVENFKVFGSLEIEYLDLSDVVFGEIQLLDTPKGIH